MDYLVRTLAMAGASATKLANLLNDHEGVITNGVSVLGEIEAAAVALEQALFDEHPIAHSTLNPCSPDADVQRLEKIYCAVMDARRAMQHRQAAIRRLQQQMINNGVQDLAEEFETAYTQAVEAAATADAAAAATTAASRSNRDAANLAAAMGRESYHVHDESYKNFRQSLWEVRNGEVPFGTVSSRSKTHAANRNQNDAVDHDGDDPMDQDDDDDDIVVTSQKTTYKCPISLQIMRDPYTSRVCNHSYSDAIFASFQRGMREIQCPVTGCGRKMVMADVRADSILKRRIARWLRSHPDGEEDEADQEDVVDIYDVVA